WAGDGRTRKPWHRPCFAGHSGNFSDKSTNRANDQGKHHERRITDMPSRSPSRRLFLRRAGAALAAAPFARPALAQGKRDVSLRLDWVFQGPNAGFMIAHEKGFYAKAGLNVDIGPGKGSGSTAQLVASRAAQFGFSC